MSSADNYFKVSVWDKRGERLSIRQEVFPFVSGDRGSTKHALSEAMIYWCALPVKEVHVAQLSVFRPCDCVESPQPEVFGVIGEDRPESGGTDDRRNAQGGSEGSGG
jgi:hypothetical protein